MYWRAIKEATWDNLFSVAKQMHQVKLGYRSTVETQWNMDEGKRIMVRLAGLIGEALVASELGLKLNLNVLRQGDGGYDFPGIDVKTSTFLSDPHLKVPPSQVKEEKFYVLTVVDLNQRRARVAGYATCDMVRKAPQRNYGNGPMHFIRASELIAGLPPVGTQA